MTEAILLLRIEHHQADNLLSSIEDQIDLDGDVDLELMQSIAEYFSGYPDECHHPVEDLVFRKMNSRDPKRAAAVAEILSEHKGIADATGRLTGAVEQAANGGNGGMTELKAVMREFVDKYRAHMESEEKEFFPVALELLKDSDWAEVEYKLFDHKDPLYDRDVEKRFRRLRNHIDELASESFRRGAFMRKAKTLQSLDSISAFNDEMKRTGSDYRLIKHPEGAYGLNLAGHSIVDIPNCDESRAAWCAYFYVNANNW